MVHLEGTLEHRSSPLQAYIDGASSTVGSPLAIGEREMELPSQISCIGLDSGMIRPELHKVQHLHAGVVLCAGVRAFDPSLRVGWQEILSWYLMEWAMEMVVDPSLAQ